MSTGRKCWLLAFVLSSVFLIVALAPYKFDGWLFAALFVNAPIAVMYGYFTGRDDWSCK